MDLRRRQSTFSWVRVRLRELLGVDFWWWLWKQSTFRVITSYFLAGAVDLQPLCTTVDFRVTFSTWGVDF